MKLPRPVQATLCVRSRFGGWLGTTNLVYWGRGGRTKLRGIGRLQHRRRRAAPPEKSRAGRDGSSWSVGEKTCGRLSKNRSRATATVGCFRFPCCLLRQRVLWVNSLHPLLPIVTIRGSSSVVLSLHLVLVSYQIEGALPTLLHSPRSWILLRESREERLAFFFSKNEFVNRHKKDRDRAGRREERKNELGGLLRRRCRQLSFP